MRGSAGSFGITTSIEVSTYPTPPSTTLFFYLWDLDVADAASAVGAFQSFARTDLSPQFGGLLDIFKSTTEGRVNFTLIGTWYRPASEFNTTIAPLLAQLTASLQTRSNASVGPYIDSVVALSGSPTPNTSVAPETPNTFYPKSLMTPEDSPMSPAALNAFTHYLAHEGVASETVRSGYTLSRTKLIVILQQCFVQLGLWGGKNSAVKAVTKPDASQLPSHTEARFSQFNFMHIPLI
jgi:hypothetical protein